MKNLFKLKKPVIIGMIHLPPTLSYSGWPGLDKFVEKAKKDLYSLEKGGVDAALIENDGDQPCQVEGVADVVAPMTAVAYELSKIASIPLGVEVLLNDPKASLSIAKTAGLDFIRCDYFVDRMKREGYGEFKIDPKGVIEFRKKIKAENVKILADVQVKYATMLEKKTITTSVEQAIHEGAEGVIVSGTISGIEPNVQDLKEAKVAAKGRIPIIAGSGFSINNAKKLLRYADWAIVGNSVKTNGFVDTKKVKELMKLVKHT